MWLLDVTSRWCRGAQRNWMIFWAFRDFCFAHLPSELFFSWRHYLFWSTKKILSVVLYCFYFHRTKALLWEVQAQLFVQSPLWRRAGKKMAYLPRFLVKCSEGANCWKLWSFWRSILFFMKLFSIFSDPEDGFISFSVPTLIWPLSSSTTATPSANFFHVRTRRFFQRFPRIMATSMKMLHQYFCPVASLFSCNLPSFSCGLKSSLTSKRLSRKKLSTWIPWNIDALMTSTMLMISRHWRRFKTRVRLALCPRLRSLSNSNIAENLICPVKSTWFAQKLKSECDPLFVKRSKLFLMRNFSPFQSLATGFNASMVSWTALRFLLSSRRLKSARKVLFLASLQMECALLLWMILTRDTPTRRKAKLLGAASPRLC